jgi:ABC-type branched-subunit amino acid transport system substrate-binding protein
MPREGTAVLDPRLRAVAIVNGVVLVAGALSVGQVRYEHRHKVGSDSLQTLPGTDGSNNGGTSTPGALPTSGPGSLPTPGATSGPGTRGTGGTGKPGGNGGGGGVTPPPVTVTTDIPNFGLRTQGVTKDSVLIGADYDKGSCPQAQTLAGQFSAAATGDQEKAFTTFVRYVNDTGGIRGRTLKFVSVDDGGLYCPEKHQAAAIELVDQRKVFMDIAGLHEVSDLLAPKHLPFLGGRSTLAEQRKQGYGQFQLFQDAESDYANWASFGRNYLQAHKKNPCLIHPDTPDFNNLTKYLNKALADQGYAFKDTIAYKDDPSTATQQAETSAAEMKGKCDSVWLIANNFIADVFFTQAAAHQQWHPIWTWTARTAGIDTQLGGSLMEPSEWANSIGLSTRIKAGQSPYEGNCANIYSKYNPNDGYSGSAAVLVACPAILLSAEAMRRAVDVTGQLTGNSLMLGVNAIRGDFFYDATVPLTFSVPGLNGPFDFTGFDLQTVAKWSTSAADYTFPEYPIYWKIMGPNKSGGVDIRSALLKKYHPPK